MATATGIHNYYKNFFRNKKGRYSSKRRTELLFALILHYIFNDEIDRADIVLSYGINGRTFDCAEDGYTGDLGTYNAEKTFYRKKEKILQDLMDLDERCKSDKSFLASLPDSQSVSDILTFIMRPVGTEEKEEAFRSLYAVLQKRPDATTIDKKCFKIFKRYYDFNNPKTAENILKKVPFRVQDFKTGGETQYYGKKKKLITAYARAVRAAIVFEPEETTIVSMQVEFYVSNALKNAQDKELVDFTKDSTRRIDFIIDLKRFAKRENSLLDGIRHYEAKSGFDEKYLQEMKKDLKILCTMPVQLCLF